jgi:hypothetical protein
MSEERLRTDPRWVGLGVAAAVLLGLAVWLASLPSRGQEFVIQSGSAEGTLYLAASLDAARELDRIDRDGDKVTLARLVLEGKVLVVADRTPVVITDHSWTRSLYQIQMSAGNLSGQRGWVPRQVLAKPKP